MSDGQRYGDPLSPEREAELQALLDAGRAAVADGETRTLPFAGVRLRGADVAWLAAPLRDPDHGMVPGLHLEGADLRQAHLERADLRYAHLEGAEFWRAHLEGAYLYGAHLEDASLDEAHLESAGFFAAHLEGARLLQAHLEGADLVETRLEGARLNHAHLAGADLTRAHLESRVYAPDDPNLARIHAVNPAFPMSLPPADLRGALLDDATILRDATLSDASLRAGPRVSDVHWSGASLGALDWTPFTRRGALLDDERAARDWRARPYVEPAPPKPETPSDAPASQPPLVPDVPDDATASDAAVSGAGTEAATQGDPHAAGVTRAARTQARRAFTHARREEGIAVWARAARANDQLARALRAQGLSDEADHFAYRARVARRGVLRRRRAWGRWLAAGWLGFAAGHGYRFGRALALYLGVIAAFTGLSLLVSAGLPQIGLAPSGPPLQWYDALALSATSFHGRGFFQFPLTPGDTSALLSVIESLIGLFIELGVVAAFARRYLMDR